VPRQAFLDELEVSRATFKRDLDYLRNRMNAPVVFAADAGGYRLDKQQAGPRFELPGLWFSEDEAYALLMMQHLLSSLDHGGLLGPHIAPLMDRLNAVIGSRDAPAAEVRNRVRLLSFASRKMPLEFFAQIGNALFKRKRLRMQYYARSTDSHTVREVSPQRLVHYRENWYLDTWCHLRNDLRSFSVDGIRAIEVLDAPAKEVSLAELDAYLMSSYGIVRGGESKRARLRFSRERARWVASEVWHPEQKGAFDAKGRYLLELPYRDDRELVLDILRHGGEVEVMAPKELRAKVRDEHARAVLANADRDVDASAKAAPPTSRMRTPVTPVP
jgi:predicted DNA-binding transcriptional regulator YafY